MASPYATARFPLPSDPEGGITAPKAWLRPTKASASVEVLILAGLKRKQDKVRQREKKILS